MSGECVRCGTCNGSGLILAGLVTREMATDAGEPQMEGMEVTDRCPECGGSGHVLP